MAALVLILVGIFDIIFFLVFYDVKLWGSRVYTHSTLLYVLYVYRMRYKFCFVLIWTGDIFLLEDFSLIINEY